MMIALALALAMLALTPMASSAGAFGSLWTMDLRGVRPGEVVDEDVPHVLFHQHAIYGLNNFVVAVSTASQYYYDIWAIYPQGEEDIVDVSDIYDKVWRHKRQMVYMGTMSLLLLMAKILPMLLKSIIPWYEVIVQSNDYPGEEGCRVTVSPLLPPI